MNFFSHSHHKGPTAVDGSRLAKAYKFFGGLTTDSAGDGLAENRLKMVKNGAA